MAIHWRCTSTCSVIGARARMLALAAFAMLAAAAPAAVIVEYRFDGDAMDTSGNNEHGTLMGGATFGAGMFGQALQLDGVNDFVHVPIGDYALVSFTLECWINVPTYSRNLHYMSLYQNAYLVLGDYSGSVITTWADGLTPVSIFDSVPSPTPSAWHHVAFTYDGANQRVFFDGMQVAISPTSGAVTLNPMVHNTGLNIGARHTGSTQWVLGLIDNARIHDVALAPMDLGFFRDGSVAEIRTIAAPRAQVAVGETGLAVSMSVENIGMNAVNVTGATLTFTDASMFDVTGEYTIAAAPGNPTSIAAGATETFNFTVDVSPLATLGTITIDGDFSATDSVTMSLSRDQAADTPDAWDVVGAVAQVLQVDAPASVVAQGGAGYAVSVSVQNPGLNPLNVSSVDLSFMGALDRTSEYAVAPAPGNPTSVGAGATEVFDFLVDVSVTASLELITIDASFTGSDAVSGAPVVDLDADVTDTWQVMQCAASLCGDCNGDGLVTILDALTAAQHSAVLITLVGVDFTNCNVIGTLEPSPAAMVDVLDALTLAQFAAGLPAPVVCC